MKKRDQIKKKAIGMTILCLVISVFILSVLTDASAMENEIEDIDGVSVQSSPVQQHKNQRQHIDPFNLAIVGISLGCMMFAASVGRNRMHRRQLETQIQGLDSFLTSRCAVGFHINGCNDNDPMINSIKDIQNGRDIKLKEYEEHKNVMVRSVSEIETEVMKLWG